MRMVPDRWTWKRVPAKAARFGQEDSQYQWTHYNHRVRNGMDVFMLWNGAKDSCQMLARFKAKGKPEAWNPGTKEIIVPEFKKVSSGEVEVSLSLPAEESVLVVFK